MAATETPTDRMEASAARLLESRGGADYEPFFAMSQAICTCRMSGNISGARRAFASTAPSKDFACACCAPLSRIFNSERSIGTNVSIAMAGIGDFMSASADGPVGWVELSETHQIGKGWVSARRRGRHPTRRAPSPKQSGELVERAAPA